MSINKFGVSIGGAISKTGSGRGEVGVGTSSSFVRNFVRNNALCIAGASNDFDAKSCKIRHLAEPRDAADATNMRYVHRFLEHHTLLKYEQMRLTIARQMRSIRKELDDRMDGKMDALSKKMETRCEKPLRKLGDDVQSLSSDIGLLAGIVHDETDGAKAECATIRKNVDGKMDALSKRMEREAQVLDTNSEGQVQKIAANEKRVNECINDLHLLAGVVRLETEDLAALQKRVQSEHTQLSELGPLILEIAKQIDKLKQVDETLRNDLAALQKRVRGEHMSPSDFAPTIADILL